METIVIGHRNPDMDAIVSVLAYAELKRLTGEPGVIAGRCGNTNERIDYVLGKFGVEAPAFFSDVRPRVSDAMERSVVAVNVREPVYRAMIQIGENRFRGLPVVDDDNRCLGLISGFKISRHLFPLPEEIASTREVHASLANLCTTIDGTVHVGRPSEQPMRHVLTVAAMRYDTFVERVTSLDLVRSVLVVGDRSDIQRFAIQTGIKALVVTGGMAIDDDILEAARAQGTVLIASPHDTATTVLLARSAVTAERMLSADFESLDPDIPLEEARRQVAMSSQFAFPVVDEAGRLTGILSKSDFLKPVPRQLILLDHNELSQAVKGAEDVSIVEIIDHHRLGTISTDLPILFLNRPVGSTSTIVATCYEQAGVPIPPPIAGILMAGVISDTLNLTSPTTTDVDRRIMALLAGIAEVDPTRLAEEIFSVGSPLLTMTPDQAVTADCKEYEEAGERFSAAQIEELSFSNFATQKNALIDAVENFRVANDLLFSALLVTDINTQNSILIVRGDERYTKHIDYPEIEPHLWHLEGIVSRKKQLLPYLTSLLARLA